MEAAVLLLNLTARLWASYWLELRTLESPLSEKA